LTSSAFENYREARADEAEQIAALRYAQAVEAEGRDLGLETCLRGVRAVFADPAKGRWYVALLGRQVAVSLLVAPEWSDWRNGWLWRVSDVHVAPEHRGGTLLSGLFLYLQTIAMVQPEVLGIRFSVRDEDAGVKEILAKIGLASSRRDQVEWVKTV
jgi:hypothetical protein